MYDLSKSMRQCLTEAISNNGGPIYYWQFILRFCSLYCTELGGVSVTLHNVSRISGWIVRVNNLCVSGERGVSREFSAGSRTLHSSFHFYLLNTYLISYLITNNNRKPYFKNLTPNLNFRNCISVYRVHTIYCT